MFGDHTWPALSLDWCSKLRRDRDSIRARFRLMPMLPPRSVFEDRSLAMPSRALRSQTLLPVSAVGTRPLGRTLLVRAAGEYHASGLELAPQRRRWRDEAIQHLGHRPIARWAPRTLH